ncbi:double zinc ribbon [Methylomusa anaerophila]|uniref:Double zinc ribbon n=1 Tax=Methylomusa anaerophila TaxID=1930071 RepID=A0A348AL55_9FIRM|nr:double zinc ribbon [Methylomusa anaerophila]
MQCPVCSKQIQDEFKFCPHCGNKVNTSCAGCGKSLQPEWVTCPYCGLAAKGQAAQSTPSQPSQHPQNPQYNQYPPTYPPGRRDYHSGSSGHHQRRKKGLLGNFFSS